MTTPQDSAYDLVARRKRAVRTALVIGGVAALIYAGFILSGVLSA
jgi:hypothetical protein